MIFLIYFSTLNEEEEDKMEIKLLNLLDPNNTERLKMSIFLSNIENIKSLAYSIRLNNEKEVIHNDNNISIEKEADKNMEDYTLKEQQQDPRKEYNDDETYVQHKEIIKDDNKGIYHVARSGYFESKLDIPLSELLSSKHALQIVINSIELNKSDYYFISIQLFENTIEYPKYRSDVCIKETKKPFLIYLYLNYIFLMR